MDYTNEDRQKKFREQMKEAGKKSRTFFLSDAAMDSIKSYKTEKNFRSLNHALEYMLAGKEVEPTEPIDSAVQEKITVREPTEPVTVKIYEPTAEQKLILDQAKIVAGAYRNWKQSPSNETAPALAREAEILAGLF